MALSNLAIIEALQKGRLRISPQPEPPPGSPKTPYDTTSVDLRLGNEIVVITRTQPISIDLRERKFAELISDKNSKSFTITEEQPFKLQPNQFVLAKTKEEVELPLSGKLCARVEGKSSYARCGMLVHFTAPTIHAGFAGTITLEIINLGAFDVLLYPGMYICQFILDEVIGPDPVPKESQFQGQTRPAGTR